ncbi:VirB4 family type IV secretion system protein [Candidatus Chloroploca sp. Khr17]|uniref:VirB4 family type IV secretion system protein n=1 Tax=Candidatus Chloroploca sp. Khr17 TaxID=2496869 RepID=UPI00101CD1F1|nr:hypothetical protein [Candidatus Chloroploca sp. Khr17]
MDLFQLHSFPLEQVADREGFERRVGAWFAARPYPARLLALSRGFSLQTATERMRREQAPLAYLAHGLGPLLRAIDALVDGTEAHDPAQILRALPEPMVPMLLTHLAPFPAMQALVQAAVRGEPLPVTDALVAWATLADTIVQVFWRLPWMQEMMAFYRTMEQAYVRSATYLLLTWPPPDVAPTVLSTTLRHAFGRPVTHLPVMPTLLGCAYREHATRLEPLEAGQPWLAALHSYDLQDIWDASTLHPLLATNYDVILALDIQTMTHRQAQRTAELAFNAANLVARDHRLLDTRAQRVTADATHALHELHHQTLHRLQLAVIVGGRDPDDLEINVAETRDRLGSSLRLMRAAGAQAEVLKLCSPLPRTHLEAPWKPRTQLSQAVGCMAGIVGLHRPTATTGIFLGIDALRRAPVFMDLFQQQQAAHTIVLGKSGYGKTVFINLLAERAAAVHGMQVIGIDAFANGLRVAAALAGAVCYRVGLEHTVNLLDVVFDTETDGGWLPNQVLHVVGQLALLFGQPGQTTDHRQAYQPRIFSVRERGVLGRVIQALYETHGVTPETPIAHTPLLGDLLTMLEAEVSPVAHALALDLRYLLYGTEDRHATTLTPEGAAFHGATTIDWNFRRDVVYYDFAQVPELLRPFYYLQAIGAIHRYLRLPGRDRQRKIFLEIDEFGYASQVEEVVRLAHAISKTARKYGCGIVLVDQNPSTFFGTETGRQIYEQAAARIFFHLEPSAAQEVAAALPDVPPAYLAFLPRAEPGECLAVLRNDVYQLNVELNRREAHSFMGS